jgi:hypothetical protein
MVRGLQLMYTPAATPEAVGYQFVAETPGIEKAERDMLERYSTPSGPLTEGKNFSRATSIYKLPTGRVAISRLANIGKGYDGRPDAICTHTLVISAEDYAGLFGHLSWISETLKPDPSVRGTLPMLELPPEVGVSELDPPALAAWAPDRYLISLGLAALLQGNRIIIEDAPRAQDPLAALEVFLSLLPRWRREQLSICTFDVTMKRPFDLMIVPESVIAESSVEDDRVVVKLRSSCGTASSFGPYVDFAVGAAYEGRWSTRTAFLRFFGTLSQGKANIDACWMYWNRLENEKPPTEPLALALFEADLSILSASIAPDRSEYHLGQAITRSSAACSEEVMAKILFEAIPTLGQHLDGPGISSLIEKALRPVVEHHDAKILSSLLRQGLARLKAAPEDATLKKTLEGIGVSLLSCSDAPDGGCDADTVESLRQAFEVLEATHELRDLQERLLVAIATREGIANPGETKLTAGRLKNLAMDGSQGARSSRLLAMAARLYHEINDGVGEAIVEVERFGLTLAELPVPQLAPMSVDPETFHSAIHALTTGATDSKGDEGSTSTEPVNNAESKSVPLPPSSREALELFRHIAGHPGTPMGPVILSISNAFSSRSRTAEGLLWIEAVAELPESKQWEEALFEGSLKLCEAQQPPQLSPSLALRTYWRLAMHGPPSKSGSSADWGERMHMSLAKWTDLQVASPPLTVWDVVLAAGIPSVILKLPPSDLSSWASSVRKAKPVALGANAEDLRAAFTDVMDHLKASIGRNGESPGGFMDRMRKRLRADPYEHPYVLLQGMKELIPGFTTQEET